MGVDENLYNLQVGDICPECQRLNLTKRLRYFLINLNYDRILKCESSTCIYPYDENTIDLSDGEKENECKDLSNPQNDETEDGEGQNFMHLKKVHIDWMICAETQMSNIAESKKVNENQDELQKSSMESNPAVVAYSADKVVSKENMEISANVDNSTSMETVKDEDYELPQEVQNILNTFFTTFDSEEDENVTALSKSIACEVELSSKEVELNGIKPEAKYFPKSLSESSEKSSEVTDEKSYNPRSKKSLKIVTNDAKSSGNETTLDNVNDRKNSKKINIKSMKTQYQKKMLVKTIPVLEEKNAISESVSITRGNDGSSNSKGPNGDLCATNYSSTSVIMNQIEEAATKIKPVTFKQKPAYKKKKTTRKMDITIKENDSDMNMSFDDSDDTDGMGSQLDALMMLLGPNH